MKLPTFRYKPQEKAVKALVLEHGAKSVTVNTLEAGSVYVVLWGCEPPEYKIRSDKPTYDRDDKRFRVTRGGKVSDITC